MGVKNSISESDLVRLISNGDVPALGLLYDRYAPLLFGSILKMVKDEKLASEVLEKTFLEVWRKCQSGDCLKISLFAWMNNLSRDLVLAKLDERIHRSKTSESVSHYQTSFGTVLTAVNFT